MKYLLCFCAAMSLHVTCLVAQQTEHLCVQDVQALPTISWNGQPGGIYLPSKGLLNALVVFAQYPDDSLLVNHPEWPKDQPPRLMGEWVDSVWTGSPTPYSMTDYYNQMSMGQFRFIGKARFVVAPRTRAEYMAAGMKRPQIHEELLTKLDSTLDFEEFDRWDMEDNFVHIERSDKIVDLVIVIWRNLNEDVSDPQAKANIRRDLSFPGDQAELGDVNQSLFVDNNNRRINMWYGIRSNNGQIEPAGSGPVLTKGYLKHSFMSVMQTCIHEVGHYLIGGNSYHVGFGCWGMVSVYGIRNFTANSFERHRLGWITLNSLDATSQPVGNAALPDYVTTGVAWRYVIDSATAQYFFIENHQGISRWDTRTGGPTSEHGVYVLRQDSLFTPAGSANHVRMIPADGLYDWTVPRRETHSCCGTTSLAVFKQLAADRHNGYHDCDKIPYVDPVTQTTKADDILLLEDAAGNATLVTKFAGDGHDAFRMGYQQVFSPWSNPISQDKYRNSTGFGFEVTAVTATANGDVYTLNFYPQNAASASPATVQAFAVAAAAQSGGSAVLSWQPNEEPDLKWYKIYRTGVMQSNTVPADADFTLLATLNATNGGTAVAQWTDTSVNVSTAPYIFGVYYRISAVDSTDKESVKVQQWMYLNQVQGGNGTGKRGAEMEQQSVQISVVPNPSTDMFWFTFSLPEGGPVVLEVTDVTGRTVATVADRAFVAGEHTIQFDGSFLSKGVYFYRLTTGSGAVSGILRLQ